LLGLYSSGSSSGSWDLHQLDHTLQPLLYSRWKNMSNLLAKSTFFAISKDACQLSAWDSYGIFSGSCVLKQ
jgi:hypothetical protein